MVETLTESFCERCGTRYEFKAPTRLNPLRKTRGFIGGLKNYLTSQDALSDAMGDAMRTEEDQLAAAQLEAFHESFNFCIGCRQYTCLNCWNDEAGRCRSCAPVAGTDDLADRLAASMAAGPALAADEPTMAQDDIQRRLGLEAWPSADVGAPAPSSNGHAAHDWPSADEMAARHPAGEDEWQPEPAVTGETLEREPVATEFERPFAAEAEPPVAELEHEREPVATEFERPFAAEAEPPVAELEHEPAPVEPQPLRVVAWDTDAAYEVEPELEPIVAEAALEPVPEPIVAEADVDVEPEPEMAEIPEPEPAVALAHDATALEAEDEPVAASIGEEPAPDAPRIPRIAPIRETILRFPPQAEPPSADVVEEPVAAEEDSPEVAARRAQLDLLGLGDPGQGPVAPQRPAVIPYRSRGAAPTAIELAARGAFWEASAREVAGATGTIGVQSCGQCGLSLSASARFCRRCGTRQAQSA